MSIIIGYEEARDWGEHNQQKAFMHVFPYKQSCSFHAYFPFAESAMWMLAQYSKLYYNPQY